MLLTAINQQMNRQTWQGSEFTAPVFPCANFGIENKKENGDSYIFKL